MSQLVAEMKVLILELDKTLQHQVADQLEGLQIVASYSIRAEFLRYIISDCFTIRPIRRRPPRSTMHMHPVFKLID